MNKTMRWSAVPLCALVLAGCGVSAAGDADVPDELGTASPGADDVTAHGLGAHPTVQRLVPDAPMTDDVWHGARPCEGERCAAAEPLGGGFQAQNLVKNGLKHRGSNSQLAMPQNIVLGDIDNDGATDFLQYASNKIFVSHTDYAQTGVLHLYLGAPIKRVITGDFHGDKYDQTCVILTDNTFQCYGASPDRTALWWSFTQGSFIADNEATIVGDFDGDGRDDLLVYPTAGGPYRMYSWKGDFFFNPTPSWSPGNLGAFVAAGMKVRAGDFNGDGRDDLAIVMPAGQLAYLVSVFDGTNNTFWWSFTTASGFIGTSDQVSIARIDDDKLDDVVVRNQTTGGTRLYKMSLSGSVLTPITNVSLGQLDVSANSSLFWGVMHGSLTETGAANRDDPLVYLHASKMVVRADARWTGSAYTYWWAYTQYAPNNDTGWAAFSAHPFTLVKCKFFDVAATPQTDAFYQGLLLGNGGVADFWRDVSYGSYNLYASAGSQVVSGWYTVPQTQATSATLSRWDRAGACMSAWGGSLGSSLPIAMYNAPIDSGNAGATNGRVVMDTNTSNATFLNHETGHSLGYGHSYDDSTRQAASWSGPGEYFDPWDIMSAMAVYSFAGAQGTSGPGMNAPYRARMSFIAPQRMLTLAPGAVPTTQSLTLASLMHPEGAGYLMVRIGTNSADYFTVEYRTKDAWDQAIPAATVLIHEVKNGVSYLITDGAPYYNAQRTVGTSKSFVLNGRSTTVSVNSFATAGFNAGVTITY